MGKSPTLDAPSLYIPDQFNLNPSTRISGACARILASHGVHLALTYSTNSSSIEALAAQLRDGPLRISTHQVDMAFPEQIEALWAEIKAEHQTEVDILVSNAGHGKRIQDVW